MAGKKKIFRCGHRGKGQFCHRCRQNEAQRQETTQRKAEWNEKKLSAPVQLDHLPRDVAERALQVIVGLRRGKSYLDFKGKRMKTMGQRNIISIPIGKKYRLICKDHEGELDYIEAITHETYNNRLSSGGWN